MADYWKSQPRHHCDFCSCWIADNKPSRDFHERGKKHIENVNKRIGEIRRKSEKKAQEDADMEASLKAMEQNAMKALQEDLKKDPSLAAQYGVKVKTKEEKEAEAKAAEAKKGAEHKAEGARQEALRKAEEAKKEEVKKTAEAALWEEAKSPEGWTYYWHSVSGEVTWIKPEGYKPQGEEDEEAKEQEEEPAAKKFCPTKPTSEESTSKPESKPPKQQPQQECPQPQISNYGPQPKPCPYGGWETVEREEPPTVNLELPVQKNVQDIRVVTVSEPKFKFREKTAPPLGSELVAFKKRNKRKTDFQFRKKDNS